MSKKVFFDGLGIVDNHFSGIGQYILGILRGLDAILEKEKQAGNKTPDIRVMIPYDSVKRYNSFGFKHLQAQVLPMPFIAVSGLWYRSKMPPLDLMCGPGFYIFTRFVDMTLALPTSSSAVIVYDLSFVLFPQYGDERLIKFLTTETKNTVNRARTVFTISKSAASEIEKTYKLGNKPLIVAPPAADQRYFYRRSEAEIKKVKEKYQLPKKYIISLSNLEPRKNLDALIDAYCDLPESYRKDVSLLLVGVNGWKTDKLFKKIIARVTDGYDIVGPSEYISDADKPAVLSGATMLVYPSHYEGFGMPPLEALACGTPVITSNNSSLPEAVGKAGTLLNGKDVKAITKAIRYNLDNLQEVTQKSIIEGPAQAREFSWEASAQKYWQVIQERTK